MNQYTYVGLDVHLDSITAAIVEGDSENVSVQKRNVSIKLRQNSFMIRLLSVPDPAC
jgi:hypothetical protein